jgi:hypothetical protein
VKSRVLGKRQLGNQGSEVLVKARLEDEVKYREYIFLMMLDIIMGRGGGLYKRQACWI